MRLNRLGIALAMAVAMMAAIPSKADAPDNPFSFDNPSINAASCGGGFSCYGGFVSGMEDASVPFTVNCGSPFTVRLWTQYTYYPIVTISGGQYTCQQTVVSAAGAYPVVYHVSQSITNASEFVDNGNGNGSQIVDNDAMATLDYDWQRVGHSGRGGGWSIQFPNGGIKLSGSY